MKSPILRKTMRLASIAMLTAAAFGPPGCGLDEVGDPGAITGPATRGIQLKLTATPDIVVANGSSTSTIRGRVLGPTGQPIANIDIVFTTNAGSVNGVGTTSARTGSDGIATVTWRAPNGLSSAGQRAQVIGRIIDGDANGSYESTAGIDLVGNVAPTCDFTMDPAGPLFTVGDFVTFTSLATDADGTSLHLTWFFGDGAEGDGRTAGHFYRKAGRFTVRHIVRDASGGQTGCAKDIGVEAEAPEPSPSPSAAPSPGPVTCSFSIGPGNSPFPSNSNLTFNSTSTSPNGTITSVAWDFDHGTPSTGAGNPASHLYDTPGDYTVSLTIGDSAGVTDSCTQNITINP